MYQTKDLRHKLRAQQALTTDVRDRSITADGSSNEQTRSHIEENRTITST